MRSVPPKLTVQRKARKAPDILMGTLPSDAVQEFHQFPLIGRLEGFSAQQGQAVDIAWLQGLDHAVCNFLGEGLAVMKIPGFGLKALLAMVGATRNEKGTVIIPM